MADSKPTLHAIPADKRERVLRAAALAFAEGGYGGTDMATLARRCGVAKGSVYNYFRDKRELYLYVCRDGLERSRAAVWGGLLPSATIFELIDTIFRRGVEFARAHPEYVILYLQLVAAGPERFPRHFSREIEKETSDRLKAALRAGVAEGLARADLDVQTTAWWINNTYIMTLAALVSPHLQIRVSEYLESPEIDVERTITALHRLLTPEPRS